ncbi:Putative NADH-flavin reductase [Paraoerskovia marina]|uniref:Putative NADH-flavin reductase n=1 Tax=Paraoerskovia marina TaxID=545619 RepID=A0A1H1M5F6_9CELL|nr:NAD(P)H-binding protein [Paraoerskovia marina]SDR81991.1 Putative NADH-flavin reductase [Paraoerskovia marina]
MRIALIGATGRTGRLVLEDALRRGHDVSVLVRDSARLAPTSREVRVVDGSVTDAESVARLLEGSDAVVSALGPTAKESDLHAVAARNLVAAMSEHGPRRFVGVSGAGIDVPGDQKSASATAISWLIQRLGGDVVKDKPAEYAVWAASGLDWTLVRPPRLVNGTAGTGELEHDAHRSTRSTKVVRADLARFVLDVVEQGLYVGTAPFVATPKG